jgi:ubiquinone/menaquinone biosynthesis C-methylase UbiE
LKLKPSSIKNRLKHIFSTLEWNRFRHIPIEDQLAKIRNDWDQRAIENAPHYIATANQEWSAAEFFASGEETVKGHILNDMVNICQGRDPRTMKILEVGCGAGRVTKALASVFGEVHGVDISAEMVRLARQALRPCGNAIVYQNNGVDLSVVPTNQFDFAFSYLVFQHIPSRAIVHNYLREVHRLLRPGALFKFQVQGAKLRARPDDTWVGVAFSDKQIMAMAAQYGFEARHRHGAGTQEFWIWYFKRP